MNKTKVFRPLKVPQTTKLLAFQTTKKQPASESGSSDSESSPYSEELPSSAIRPRAWQAALSVDPVGCVWAYRISLAKMPHVI